MKTEFKVKIVSCRVMSQRLVPARYATPSVLDFEGFKQKVGANTPSGIRQLRALKAGDFVGVTKMRGRDASFIIAGTGNDSIARLLRGDPGWEKRLVSVFKVVDIDWGGFYQDLEPLQGSDADKARVRAIQANSRPLQAAEVSA